MRLLVDECLSTKVAERLGSFGHDAIHAADLALLGADDDAVVDVVNRGIDDAGRIGS